jgi:hypothetical protein
MPVELGMSASLWKDPGARSQNKDEKGVNTLYGELLRSACSLGEILDNVGRSQSKSGHGDTSSVRSPRTGCDAVVARINSGIAAEGGNLSGSELKVPRATDIHVPAGSGIPGRFHSLERFRRDRFPSHAKNIAFAVLCVMAVAAASIAGPSIIRGNRDSAPASPHVQSDVPGGLGAAAAAPIDTIDGLLLFIAQPPSATSTAAAERAPQSDTGQPPAIESPGAVTRREGADIAKAPVENMPVALPSRAHLSGKHKASAPHRYVEARRRVRQQAPIRESQPVYYEQRPRSPYTDFDRGYNYGGPAAHSDSGN